MLDDLLTDSELNHINSIDSVITIFYAILKAIHIYPNQNIQCVPVNGSALSFLTSVGSIYIPRQLRQGVTGQIWWQEQMLKFYAALVKKNAIVGNFSHTDMNSVVITMDFRKDLVDDFQKLGEKETKLGKDIIELCNFYNVTNDFFLHEDITGTNHFKLQVHKFKQDLEDIFKSYYNI